MVINNFDTNDMYEKFKLKSQTVAHKFVQKKVVEVIQSDKKDRKLAIIDIDGIITTYPEDFMRVYGQQNMSFSSFKRSLPEEYEEAKFFYRTSGLKEQLKVREGAVEFLNRLKERDIAVILLTARPYDEIYRICLDTYNWLKNNKIYYNVVIWNSNKAQYVIDNFKNNKVVFCLDDDIWNANQFAPFFATYLFENSLLYEDEFDMHQKISVNLDNRVCCIKSFDEINLSRLLE